MIPLRDSLKTKKVPWVSLTLIALNIYVFLRELIAPNLDPFIAQYALTPANLSFTFSAKGGPASGWPLSLSTLLTFQFLHAGFIHLFSNMWFLWVFGDNVEESLGRVKFLLFYLISGVAAGLSQYFLNTSSTVPMLGASGSVAGILGAYMVLFPHSRIETLVPSFGFWVKMAVPAPVMLGFWFFTQLFNGVASLAIDSAAIGGIAFFAHVGGFLTGYLLAKKFSQGG